jgi:N-acetylglucosaminyldiphosphoundecaprenol N-acetyl-beta-D-mannosaminyltransferase
MKMTEILGVKINHDLDMARTVSLIDKKLQEKAFFQVCTTNPEFIVDAQKDAQFKSIINNSFLSLPDGSGILFALDYLHKVSLMKKDMLFPLKSFIAGITLFSKLGKYGDFPPIYGTDLTQQLVKLCAVKGYTLGLVGGCPKDKWGNSVDQSINVASEAAHILSQKYPSLKVVVAESNINASHVYDMESISLIESQLRTSNCLHIDVLLVAFGHNKQEKWIHRNHDKLSVSLCIGVGGTLDDMAGYTKTPSDFYSNNNLRWLFRLIHQPWRLRRVFKAVVTFPLLVFIDTLKQQ